MNARKVVDEDGRTWECKPENDQAVPGKDVHLVCSTAGLKSPLRVKVSWQWMKIAEKGLARLIMSAAPEFSR
ncbi:MAG TPA: hypothetical protein VJ867_11260 [Gemmatimonadaceae bacterium]|nr:hypothetical protein [Gemmatimonadaceae bacterium]